jgi:hypothetical protein
MPFRGSGLTAMLELRLWSFGNPFSHRQGDHLGTKPSYTAAAPGSAAMHKRVFKK